MSGPLENPKHEQFAQAVAGGAKKGPAYKAVFGGSDKTSAEIGCRLAKNVNVKSRIDEIRSRAKQLFDNAQEKMADTAAEIEFGALMSIAEKRAFLAAVVRTPLGKLNAMSALIHSLETTGECGPDADDVPIHKLKAHDKLRAIELDSKLAGELTEKVDATTNGESLNVVPQVNLILPASFVQRRGQHASSN